MRVPIVILVACCVAAPAETIHLKNGRKILAEHVRQTASQVEYDIGDDSYAIPKTLVERVEAGGEPIHSHAEAAAADAVLPSFSSSIDVHEDALSLKIIRDGRVDEEALAAVERSGDPALGASGYFVAGKFAYERGRRDQAREYFHRALMFQPDHGPALTYYAAALMQSGSLGEAMPIAEHATRVAPDSPDAWAVLGFVYFSSDRNQQAAGAWKRALALRPDPSLQQYLAKVERELHAEADYSQRDSSHFVLHYEGGQTPESLRRALLDALESDYQELTSELDVAPRNTIAVVLYSDQTFFDVTQAPAWTAALNDGKLRIPIHGMTEVSPELARVLKHELAHSFINQVSHGRAPQWLHEGIAQMVEGKNLNGRGAGMAQAFQQKRMIPFNALEAGFMRMSTPVALMAYDESLAATEYINETYGMSDLRRLLERIGEGSTPEAALRATIHSGYADLENDVARFLQQKYAN